MKWLFLWLRPLVTTQVSIRIGVPKIGIVTERCDLLSVGDLQCWSANASAYPQLGLIEHKSPMWRWRVRQFEEKRKAASMAATSDPLNLRKSAPQ